MGLRKVQIMKYSRIASKSSFFDSSFDLLTSSYTSSIKKLLKKAEILNLEKGLFTKTNV